MKKIRFVIVEDDKIIRESMKEILLTDDRLECAGVYQKGEDFISAFKDLGVDVVLMDIGLPGKTGTEVVAILKPIKPEVQFLMCTSFDDPERIFSSLKAGATGYVLKNESPDKIIASILDIYRGGSPMSAEIARMVVGSFSQKKEETELFKSLTPREQEILVLLAKGYQYREIGEQLFISIETVRTYLRRIYEKLQVRSKIEALNKVFPK